MALTKEEQELVLRVRGELEVERLTRELQKEGAELRKLEKDLAAGTISLANYEAEVKRLQPSLTANQQALDRTSSSLRGFRTNIMGLSYGLNDFFSVSGNLQQRLNGLANNMPMILDGWGRWGLYMSAALPIIAALTPAIKELYEKMSDSKDIDEAISHVDGLKKKIQDLSKTPVKIGVDSLELDSLKARLESLESGQRGFGAMGAHGDSFEEMSGAGVKKVFGNIPGGSEVARDKMRAVLVSDFTKDDSELKQTRERQAKREQELAALKASPLAAGETPAIREQSLNFLAKEIAAAQQAAMNRTAKLGQSAEPALGDLYNKATSGNYTAQQELAKLAERSGQGGLATDIRTHSPGRYRWESEEAEKDKLDQQQQAMWEQDAKDERERNAKFEAEREKKTKELDDEIKAATQSLLKDLGTQLKAIATEAIATGHEGAGITRMFDRALSHAKTNDGIRADIKPDAAHHAVKQVMDAVNAGLGGAAPAQTAFPKAVGGGDFAVDAPGIRGRLERAKARREAEAKQVTARRAAEAQAEAARVEQRREAKAKIKLPKGKLLPAEARRRAAAQAQLDAAAQQRQQALEAGAGANARQQVNKAAGVDNAAVEAATRFLAEQQAMNREQAMQLEQIRQMFGPAAAEMAAMRMQMQADWRSPLPQNW